MVANRGHQLVFGTPVRTVGREPAAAHSKPWLKAHRFGHLLSRGSSCAPCEGQGGTLARHGIAGGCQLGGSASTETAPFRAPHPGSTPLCSLSTLLRLAGSKRMRKSTSKCGRRCRRTVLVAVVGGPRSLGL